MFKNEKEIDRQRLIKKYVVLQKAIYNLADEMENFVKYDLVKYSEKYWELEYLDLIEEMNRIGKMLEKQYQTDIDPALFKF